MTPLLFSAVLLCAPAGDYERRWVYVMTNLQVAKNADDLVALIGRAHKAGYNGVVLADHKLHLLDRVPKHYFAGLDKVKTAAAVAGVELIPAVFPVGYSAGILAHDPNLAEGMPTKAVPFRVEKGVARLVPLPSGFRNGGMEDARGDRFVGFGFQDDPGVKTFADAAVAFAGKGSCRIEASAKGGPNARLTQRVKVRPHGCYRLSARVKTTGLAPGSGFKLMALGEKGPLTFQEGEVKPTQEWAEVDVVFNALGNSEVTLYAGVWGIRAGSAWVDEMRLDELALVNVLRRPGCPLTVTSDDGKTAYEEGKDFAPVADAKLGVVPWAGEYDFRHEGAALKALPEGRIKDGDTLRVSWYHPIKTHSYQVMCSLTEPKVYDVMAAQAKLVRKHVGPKTWFFSHDEIRVAGWDLLAEKSGKTPGELLADNARRCVKIVRDLDPKAKIVVWSDMFDPNHNAVDRYYAVNGSLKGSWEGLPPDVTVVNWNSGKAAESLKWFAGRGHKQIVAGFYDAPTERGFRRWDEAARGVEGVEGFMYTTWRGDYTRLEEYGKLLGSKARP